MKKLLALAEKKSRRIVGLMSGTSADGVDACLVEVTGCGAETRHAILGLGSKRYNREIRQAILEVSEADTGRTDKICLLDFILGEIMAEVALTAIREAGLVPRQVDLIASHGQTVQHLPEARMLGGYSSRSTMQIGEPSVIAERLGIPVVADFRVRDVAAGGVGAPLVALADQLLFEQDGRARAIQNIGGIANVTLLPPRQSGKAIMAFDAGPGNMIIDAVVHDLTLGEKQMDTGGEMAAAGQIDEELVERLMEDEFVNRKPPKTAGRENYGREFFRTLTKLALFGRVKGNDLVATVTAFTADAIVRNYRDHVIPFWKPDEVIVCGGGGRNPFLMERLRAGLEEIPVSQIEDHGIPNQAKEALSFALLANESICGNPSNVPGVTGASRAVVLGKFVP